MLGLLKGLALAIGNVLIDVLNGLIVVVGVVIGTVLSLFPGMGDPPSIGSQNNWIGWLNFFVPVSGLLAGLTVFVTLWIGLLAFRVIARYVKVL